VPGLPPGRCIALAGGETHRIRIARAARQGRSFTGARLPLEGAYAAVRGFYSSSYPLLFSHSTTRLVSLSPQGESQRPSLLPPSLSSLSSCAAFPSLLRAAPAGGAGGRGGGGGAGSFPAEEPSGRIEGEALVRGCPLHRVLRSWGDHGTRRERPICSAGEVSFWRGMWLFCVRVPLSCVPKCGSCCGEPRG
jgi:hypothetical protein